MLSFLRTIRSVCTRAIARNTRTAMPDSRLQKGSGRLMRPGLRIPTILLALALVLSSFAIMLSWERAAAASYSSRGTPQTTVGLTKPTILFYFSTDMPAAPDSYTMELDGRSVPAVYDKANAAFAYTPNSDLQPGPHNVRMRITYAGFEPIEKSWSFAVAEDAIPKLPSANLEQLLGLDAVNDYRELHGLPRMKLNERLNASAMAHADYLNMNRVQQSGDSTDSLHTENPEKSGYTGKTPSERGAYYGYYGNVGEDAAYMEGTVVQTIDALFDAPYHRTPFLEPGIREVGIGKAGDYTIIKFGMEQEETPKLVISPADGDRLAPTAFKGNETPDPLRMHEGVEYPVGYPIMAQYTGSAVKQVKLLGADLTDSGNKTVEFLVNTPAADDSLNDAVILIPRKPLQPDSTYRVMLSLQAVLSDGSRISEVKQWEFTTEPVPAIGKTKLHESSADYMKRFVSKAPVPRTASFGLDDDAYSIDGARFPMLRRPVVADGFSYLYVRDLASALGAGVEWDADRRAAIYTKGSRNVVLYTTRNEIAVNGELRTTDTPARLIGEHTMVPVRLLAEVLGATVTYTDITRTVTITY